jgi:hypothetical protein
MPGLLGRAAGAATSMFASIAREQQERVAEQGQPAAGAVQDELFFLQDHSAATSMHASIAREQQDRSAEQGRPAGAMMQDEFVQEHSAASANVSEEYDEFGSGLEIPSDESDEILVASRGARSDSDSENTDLSDESFPVDEEIALVPVHPLIDNNLYEKICACEALNMTDEEKMFTNEELLSLSVRESRELCKKCEYYENGKNKAKKVSITGTLPAMKSRLLAWYHIFRQEQAGGNERPFSFSSSSWTPAEDARLLEIMSSPTYQNQLRFIHQVAPRGVLDATDGSPMVSVCIRGCEN